MKEGNFVVLRCLILMLDPKLKLNILKLISSVEIFELRNTFCGLIYVIQNVRGLYLIVRFL